jgi:hypothetical protein
VVCVCTSVVRVLACVHALTLCHASKLTSDHACKCRYMPNSAFAVFDAVACSVCTDYVKSLLMLHYRTAEMARLFGIAFFDVLRCVLDHCESI